MSRRSTSPLGISMCRPPWQTQNDAGPGARRRYHLESRADQSGARSDVAQALAAREDLIQVEADAVIAGLEMDAVRDRLEGNRRTRGTRVAQTVAHGFAGDAQDVM